MTHFTDIELHQWREIGPGNDRERMVAHLAICAGCARRYAAAVRARPLHAEGADDVQDFAAAGRRVPTRGRWMTPLAAAAVLIFAVAIPLAMRRQSTPELHFRGSGIRALAPQGDVDRGSEFIWSSSLAAARYRLEIRESNRVIYATDTDGTRLPMPAQLQPGVAYWWTVTALDDHGNRLASSPRRTFTIRR